MLSRSRGTGLLALAALGALVLLGPFFGSAIAGPTLLACGLYVRRDPEHRRLGALMVVLGVMCLVFAALLIAYSGGSEVAIDPRGGPGG